MRSLSPFPSDRDWKLGLVDVGSGWYWENGAYVPRSPTAAYYPSLYVPAIWLNELVKVDYPSVWPGMPALYDICEWKLVARA